MHVRKNTEIGCKLRVSAGRHVSLNGVCGNEMPCSENAGRTFGKRLARRRETPLQGGRRLRRISVGLRTGIDPKRVAFGMIDERDHAAFPMHVEKPGRALGERAPVGTDGQRPAAADFGKLRP